MIVDFSHFAPQGWQCPVCRVVNAPHVPQCFCNNRQIVTTHIIGSIENTICPPCADAQPTPPASPESEAQP